MSTGLTALCESDGYTDTKSYVGGVRQPVSKSETRGDEIVQSRDKTYELATIPATIAICTLIPVGAYIADR